jgi:hypothetical protein
MLRLISSGGFLTLTVGRCRCLCEESALVRARDSEHPRPLWLAKLFTGSMLTPKAETKKDDKFIRSSSGLMLLVSPKNDKTAWVETGRAYERFALLSTAMNIKTAFMNQPCEVPTLRSEVQSYLNLNGAFPQLLFRFGHAPFVAPSGRACADNEHVIARL